jgi:opacity protein-like surface antigen
MNQSKAISAIAMTLLFATFATVSLGASMSNASTNLSVRESTSTSTFPTPREVLQEGLNPHIDLTMGLTNLEGSFNTGAEYGFGFGFQPYIPFGLGMSMTHSSNTAKDKNARGIERTTVLVRGSYHFAGEIPLIKYSHVGIATGPVINQDATYFGLAPIVGFDIPVQEWVGEYISYVSIGVEAKYLMISNNESDGLTVNGALKYWF